MGAGRGERGGGKPIFPRITGKSQGGGQDLSIIHKKGSIEERAQGVLKIFQANEQLVKRAPSGET